MSYSGQKGLSNLGMFFRPHLLAGRRAKSFSQGGVVGQSGFLDLRLLRGQPDSYYYPKLSHTDSHTRTDWLSVGIEHFPSAFAAMVAAAEYDDSIDAYNAKTRQVAGSTVISRNGSNNKSAPPRLPINGGFKNDVDFVEDGSRDEGDNDRDDDDDVDEIGRNDLLEDVTLRRRDDGDGGVKATRMPNHENASRGVSAVGGIEGNDITMMNETAVEVEEEPTSLFFNHQIDLLSKNPFDALWRRRQTLTCDRDTSRQLFGAERHKEFINERVDRLRKLDAMWKMRCEVGVERKALKMIRTAEALEEKAEETKNKEMVVVSGEEKGALVNDRNLLQQQQAATVPKATYSSVMPRGGLTATSTKSLPPAAPPLPSPKTLRAANRHFLPPFVSSITPAERALGIAKLNTKKKMNNQRNISGGGGVSTKAPLPSSSALIDGNRTLYNTGACIETPEPIGYYGNQDANRYHYNIPTHYNQRRSRAVPSTSPSAASSLRSVKPLPIKKNTVNITSVSGDTKATTTTTAQNGSAPSPSLWSRAVDAVSHTKDAIVAPFVSTAADVKATAADSSLQKSSTKNDLTKGKKKISVDSNKKTNLTSLATANVAKRGAEKEFSTAQHRRNPNIINDDRLIVAFPEKLHTRYAPKEMSYHFPHTARRLKAIDERLVKEAAHPLREALGPLVGHGVSSAHTSTSTITAANTATPKTSNTAAVPSLASADITTTATPLKRGGNAVATTTPSSTSAAKTNGSFVGNLLSAITPSKLFGGNKKDLSTAATTKNNGAREMHLPVDGVPSSDKDKTPSNSSSPSPSSSLSANTHDKQLAMVVKKRKQALRSIDDTPVAPFAVADFATSPQPSNMHHSNHVDPSATNGMMNYGGDYDDTNIGGITAAPHPTNADATGVYNSGAFDHQGYHLTGANARPKYAYLPSAEAYGSALQEWVYEHRRRIHSAAVDVASTSSPSAAVLAKQALVLLSTSNNTTTPQTMTKHATDTTALPKEKKELHKHPSSSSSSVPKPSSASSIADTITHLATMTATSAASTASAMTKTPNHLHKNNANWWGTYHSASSAPHAKTITTAAEAKALLQGISAAEKKASNTSTTTNNSFGAAIANTPIVGRFFPPSTTAPHNDTATSADDVSAAALAIDAHQHTNKNGHHHLPPAALKRREMAKATREFRARSAKHRRDIAFAEIHHDYDEAQIDRTLAFDRRTEILNNRKKVLKTLREDHAAAFKLRSAMLPTMHLLNTAVGKREIRDEYRRARMETRRELQKKRNSGGTPNTHRQGSSVLSTFFGKFGWSAETKAAMPTNTTALSSAAGSVMDEIDTATLFPKDAIVSKVIVPHTTHNLRTSSLPTTVTAPMLMNPAATTTSSRRASSTTSSSSTTSPSTNRQMSRRDSSSIYGFGRQNSTASSVAARRESSAVITFGELNPLLTTTTTTTPPQHYQKVPPNSANISRATTPITTAAATTNDDPYHRAEERSEAMRLKLRTAAASKIPMVPVRMIIPSQHHHQQQEQQLRNDDTTTTTKGADFGLMNGGGAVVFDIIEMEMKPMTTAQMTSIITADIDRATKRRADLLSYRKNRLAAIDTIRKKRTAANLKKRDALKPILLKEREAFEADYTVSVRNKIALQAQHEWNQILSAAATAGVLF